MNSQPSRPIVIWSWPKETLIRARWMMRPWLNCFGSWNSKPGSRPCSKGAGQPPPGRRERMRPLRIVQRRLQSWRLLLPRLRSPPYWKRQFLMNGLPSLKPPSYLPLTPRRRASITWSRRWSACPLRWSPVPRPMCPLRMIIRARRIN